MHPLFVVSAGGTGAKVVESLIHLCASGQGPEQLVVLLLDVDQANGNVERTREAAELYYHLHGWDWTLRPQPPGKGGTLPLAGTRFFKTDLAVHACLDAIDTVGAGGLEVHLRNEPGAHYLLDLLYNDSEQQSKCEKGFLARPNLGSLVLGGHLRDKFADPAGGAGEFKARLLNALNGATPQQPVKLVVVGSIFGGTGASLFPVVCECLREAIAPARGGNANWSKLAPVAVMLTPYFLPDQADEQSEVGESETVDPSRFLVDTANALKHYADPAALSGYKAVYILGSDQPQLTRLRFVEGSQDQANPPLIEEVVAALAILDAGAQEIDPGKTRRIYQPPAAHIGWTNLPFAGPGSQQLALLLELASFLLLPARNGQELSGGLLQACHNWGQQFDLLPWYEPLLGQWAAANFSGAYDPSQRRGGWPQLADANVLTGNASASAAERWIAEYAYRLLLWGRTALPNSEHYKLVKMGAEMDYALVWEVMCGLTAPEIEPDPWATGPADNALVRLARGAGAALIKVATDQIPRRGLVNRDQNLPGFPGQGDTQEQSCALPIAQKSLAALAQHYSINDNVHTKFVRTEVG